MGFSLMCVFRRYIEEQIVGTSIEVLAIIHGRRGSLITSQSDSLSSNQSLSILLSSDLPLYENRVVNQSGGSPSSPVTLLDVSLQSWQPNQPPPIIRGPSSPFSVSQPSTAYSTSTGENFQDDSHSPLLPYGGDLVIYDS